jgi:hypothetical protein
MGNSLSSLGEALKRMNSIKIWQRCYLSDHADHHDITEILLEVALNTITPSINY